MKKKANAGLDHPMRLVHTNRFRKEQNKPDKVFAKFNLLADERNKDRRNEGLSKSVLVSNAGAHQDAPFGFG